MKVAAYQAPLPCSVKDALDLIRQQVQRCEAGDVAILCCPEAILGGLADNSPDPASFAIAGPARLASVLAPLASATVTTIVGFTEVDSDGRFYNAAAIFTRGRVTGLYRKLHPALRRSVYTPGREVPVFRLGSLTFGIVICNDSNFPEPAQRIAAQGASVLFVPTNNALPPDRASADLIQESRQTDRARASENRLWIVRADVAGRTGRTGTLVSHGSSAITDPSGRMLQAARPLSQDLLIAEIEP